MDGAAAMSGTAVRAANVLPLRDRREPARRWPRAHEETFDDPQGTAREPADEAEGVLEGARDLPTESDLADAFDADSHTDTDTDTDTDTATASRPVAAGSPAARSLPGGPLEAADDPTLAAWIARIARQDERALELLYDATAARVNGLVLRITQRAALAEEVLEDTYWQVWRQAPRFDADRGRPITWLLAMARSRAIDALRREQRFQHDALPEDDADAAGLSDARALPPQDLLEATRSHAHVHAALASLEPRSRQLVALAFFRGLTHEEIAEQQGLPLGTVKSLVRRALQQLRRVMEAEHA
jgi:RNA polymerase sigma factor (sigma-70 family)